MDIATLIALINALKIQYQHMPDPVLLKDKAILAYSRRVFSQLELIFASHESDDLLDALVSFFQANWTFILTHGMTFSPTAWPTTDVTHLLCDVAQYVADEKNKHLLETEQFSALGVLVPTVSLQSVHNDFPDLDSRTDIKRMLQTHVLGREGLFLLPVKLLTELDLSAAPTRIGNPYFDVFKHPADAAYLDRDEIIRLSNHSTLTRALSDAHLAYERLANDTSNLLGQLQQLCQQLAINNAYGGLGSQENAGGGAYTAIIQFMEYYQMLGVNLQGRIPGELKEQIDILWTHTTDSHINTSATEQVETCIADRRVKIMDAMRDHEALLNEISVEGAQKGALIEAAKARFEAAKRALSEEHLSGQDTFDMNMGLLTALGVHLQIASLADLAIFQSMSVSEITNMCSLPELRRQIIDQLATVENLVIFILELPSEKIHAFIHALKQELVQELIQTPDDFSALLISLNVEKCQAVGEALKDHLRAVIPTTNDFNDVLYALTPEQCRIVCAVMTDWIAAVIDSEFEFRSAIHNLMPEQRMIVIEAMKIRLPVIINTMNDYVFLITNIEPKERVVIIEAMSAKLPELPNGEFWDFHRIMTEFKYQPEMRMLVIQLMKASLPSLLNDSFCFTETLDRFSSEEKRAVMDAMKDQLPIMIRRSAYWFSTIMHELPPQERRVYIDEMKDQLPSMIQSDSCLLCVLRYLTPEERTVLFNAIEHRLPSMMIHLESTAEKIRAYLTPEEAAKVYSANWYWLLNSLADPLVQGVAVVAVLALIAGAVAGAYVAVATATVVSLGFFAYHQFSNHVSQEAPLQPGLH